MKVKHSIVLLAALLVLVSSMALVYSDGELTPAKGFVDEDAGVAAPGAAEIKLKASTPAPLEDRVRITALTFETTINFTGQTLNLYVYKDPSLGFGRVEALYANDKPTLSAESIDLGSKDIKALAAGATTDYEARGLGQVNDLRAGGYTVYGIITDDVGHTFLLDAFTAFRIQETPFFISEVTPEEGVKKSFAAGDADKSVAIGNGKGFELKAWQVEPGKRLYLLKIEACPADEAGVNVNETLAFGDPNNIDPFRLSVTGAQIESFYSGYPEDSFKVSVCQYLDGGRLLEDKLSFTVEGYADVREFISIDPEVWTRFETESVEVVHSPPHAYTSGYEIIIMRRPLDEGESRLAATAALQKFVSEGGSTHWYSLHKSELNLWANAVAGTAFKLDNLFYLNLMFKKEEHLLAVVDRATKTIVASSVVSIPYIPEGLYIENVWYKSSAAERDWTLLEGSPFRSKEVSQSIDGLYQLEVEIKGISPGLHLFTGVEDPQKVFTPETIKTAEDTFLVTPIKEGEDNVFNEPGVNGHGNNLLISGAPKDKYNLGTGADKLVFYVKNQVKNGQVLRLEKLDGTALDRLETDSSYKITFGQLDQVIGLKLDLASFNLTIGKGLEGVQVTERSLGIADKLAPLPACKTINECLAQLGQKFSKEAFK